MIRITSCSTTSSPFFERFRSRSTRYVDASIHSLLDELLDDLGETSRKIFVFCNVPQQHKPHKLAPSWEGPFIVTKVLHNGAYRLYNVEHNIDEPRAWNAELLRPFYT